ncbi:hypothetical protein [Sphingopyxis sp. YF1]|uniref:hypothetical protein n=1 Tax=Sphingopyxis sp. YF1 TaxID=2482763 RepID=UPI001F60C93F|nr:hypothetical protein [Sphingopyxis sp. YF1]
MIGAALAARAIADAGPRDLASEWPGPRPDAARGEGRRRAAGSQAGERRVVVRRDARVG